MEDGYFTKKHNKGEHQHLLTLGPLTLDLDTKRTLLRDEYVPIPPCSFNFLATLLRHSPEPVPYMTLVLESLNEGMPRLEAQDFARLQVYILRKAIEPNPHHPRYIKAVDGYGYQLVLN